MALVSGSSAVFEEGVSTPSRMGRVVVCMGRSIFQKPVVVDKESKKLSTLV
jgi:hypothetical protein